MCWGSRISSTSCQYIGVRKFARKLVLYGSCLVRSAYWAVGRPSPPLPHPTVLVVLNSTALTAAAGMHGAAGAAGGHGEHRGAGGGPGGQLQRAGAGHGAPARLGGEELPGAALHLTHPPRNTHPGKVRIARTPCSARRGRVHVTHAPACALHAPPPSLQPPRGMGLPCSNTRSHSGNADVECTP
jgi:hypothetical protein